MLSNSLMEMKCSPEYRYVWYRLDLDKHGGHVIDFYDSSTGDYKHSINVPELGGITGLAMDYEFISTMNADGSVSVWRNDVL